MIAAVVVVFHGHINVVTSVGVDEAVTGTIQGIEGDSITLTCDLRDTDEEYIWFRNPFHFLTMGESITASLPPDIANRISVSCSELLEACYLILDPVRRTDAGQYGCGYHDGNNRVSVSSGYLVVLVPPTDTSPECLLSKNSVPISSDMVQAGDQVGMSCTISGGDPRPSLYIAQDGVPLNQAVMGSFTKLYNLSPEDEGSTFTCVMTHPALSQPRTCTLLTLRRRGFPTVPVLTTTIQSSERMTSQVTSSKSMNTLRKNSNQPSSGGISVDMNTIIVIVVVIAVILIVTVIFIICFIRRSRDDEDEIKVYPPRASQDLTMDIISPNAVVTTDYDIVNIRDSRENLQESNSFSNHLSQEKTLNAKNKKEDSFPVYAKPEKPSNKTTDANTVSSTKPGEYENLPPVSNGNTSQGQGGDGIMYADLELSVDDKSDSTRISVVGKDATVYADIQKT